jgi:hypothetical protein
MTISITLGLLVLFVLLLRRLFCVVLVLVLKLAFTVFAPQPQACCGP